MTRKKRSIIVPLWCKFIHKFDLVCVTYLTKFQG